MPKPFYRVIGLMSGTSLDGLDIACCTFEHNKGSFSFAIETAETVKYPEKWSRKLGSIHTANGHELALANTEYGYFIAENVLRFIAAHALKDIDLIASHGHTIFHRPEKNFTYQLGSGAAIAGRTGITTVSDFRSIDMALGGQGAPLVPIGDALLFPEYEYCLNLGGIANISFNNENAGVQKRVAFDICPCNIPLNELAKTVGKEFDENGQLARKGSVNNDLLEKLNSLDFYKATGARSLGREWVEEVFSPALNAADIPVSDKLNTICEHIATQVGRQVKQAGKKMLVTGGGAYNSYLTERIKEHASCGVVIPGKQVIEYKEALIFAFLGLLRLEQKTNTLASVTGAGTDSTGGAVYLGKN